jgi:hypothetical protein
MNTAELTRPGSELAAQAQPQVSADRTRWIGLVILGGVFAGLAFWSWRKWPDIFIDFGSQLYYPWQIANGRDLYDGYAYVGGGPLSQYFHALLFKCFGASLTALVVSSLAVLAGMVVFIYEAFRRIADAWTATAMGLVILLCFAFSQYVWVGNYNFICPYSYEAVHGLVISIVSVGLLSLWLARGTGWFAAGTGFGLGLVFLTKPELFLALTITTGLGLVLGMAMRFKRGFLFRSIFALAAGAMLPVLLSALFFWTRFGLKGAVSATAGAWVTLLTTQASNNAFYQWCLGLDHPWQNAQSTLVWFAGYALGVLALAWCCWQFSWAKRLWERGVLVLMVAGLVLWTVDLHWFDCGWPLPLTLPVIGAHLGWHWWKRRDERLLLPMLWCAFSFFLLAKIFLHSRVWHYGFYLALPAAVLNVYYLVWFLPQTLHFQLPARNLHRLAVCSVLGVGAFRLLTLADSFYAKKTYAVGRSGDAIVTFSPDVRPHGEAIAQTVQWLEQNTPAASTLAVMPEGLIVNYLARRANPTHYASLTPLEVAAYGEENMLKSYEAHSPDYIVLIHRDSSESGLGYFGQDPRYGAAMMRWIKANYDPVWLYGSEPLQTGAGGIRILKRR